MPVITIQCGKISKDQKKEIIEEFTKKAVDIMQIPSKYFSVMISEYDDENIGHAGVTIESIKKQMKN
jgi:4-oxalocrotonate tautomerase